MKKHQPINPNFPFIWHGGDYCPEQWQYKPKIIDEDMRLMDLANVNTATLNMFAWATIEPEEGKYDFSYLDDIFERMEKRGGLVILGTPSGARPAWLAEKYPEVLRTNELGQKNLFGNRHNHCFTSPKYRELVAKINGELAKRYKNSPALALWHLSNEYNGECHCDLCKEAFRNWLKERYNNDLDALNFAWWNNFWSHKYTSWDQIDPPSPLGEMRNWTHLLNWKRFVTHQTTDFMKMEIKAIKEHTPNIPVTTNFMGAFYGLNYKELAKELDVVSNDDYPNWHHYFGPNYVGNMASFTANLMRSYKNKPYMIMENAPSATNWTAVNKLKRPNMHRLSAIQQLAHGAESILYFQWRAGRAGSEMYHGAVVDHTGTDETRVFKEVASLGKDLEKLKDIIGTTTKAEVGLFFDWENMWSATLTKGFNNTDDKNFLKTLYKHHMPFWKRGIGVDIVGYDTDLSKYKVIIAPMMHMVNDKFIDKIEKYVKDGGKFVTTYYSGMVNEESMAYLGGFPATKLMDVFGTWAEEIDSLYPQDENYVEYKGNNYRIYDMCAVIHEKNGGKGIATYKNDFYANMPAVIKNKYGNGETYYVGFRDDGTFVDVLYSEILEDANIKSEVDFELVDGTSVNARYDEKYMYVFVQNFNDKKVKFNTKDTYTNVLDNSIVTLDFELDAFGALVLKKEIKA